MRLELFKMESLNLAMKEKFDVVIIGAGPAGLACARQLKDSEFSVLIIDKNEEPGPKICAGGVRVCDLESLGLIQDEIKGCDILSIDDDNGQKVDFTTIDRRQLGQAQLKYIENAVNIKKLFGWRLWEILPNELRIKHGTETKSILFNYLVGADGSTSVVRQKLGIKTLNELMLNFIQYDLPLIDEIRQFKTLWFFYDKVLFGEWYAYIFPHYGLNMAKVGCGGSIAWLQNEHTDLKQKMDIWLKSMKINIQRVASKSALINTDYQGFDFSASQLGKVYLCGDAAGMAVYLSGEGIHQAIVSGSEIGKIILNNMYISKPLSELIQQKKQEVKHITGINKQSFPEHVNKMFNKVIGLIWRK